MFRATFRPGLAACWETFPVYNGVAWPGLYVAWCLPCQAGWLTASKLSRVRQSPPRGSWPEKVRKDDERESYWTEAKTGPQTLALSKVQRSPHTLFPSSAAFSILLTRNVPLRHY